MKKILFLLSAVLALSVQSKAQTADDVIAKYIDAIGGKDKLMAIQTSVTTAKVLQAGMEIPGVITKERPDKFEMEFTFQGKTQKQAYDGKDGWANNPFMGRDIPEKMTADELKDIKFQADFDDAFVDYAKKNYKVEYAGEEDVDGSPSYKLILTTKDGDVYDYFFDKEAALLVKQVAHVKADDGTTQDATTKYSDYQEVDGVLMPFTIENVTEYQGQSFSTFIKIDKVDVNAKVDESVFEMPETKETGN